MQLMQTLTMTFMYAIYKVAGKYVTDRHYTACRTTKLCHLWKTSQYLM